MPVPNSFDRDDGAQHQQSPASDQNRNGRDGRGLVNGADGRGLVNGADGRGHLNGSDGHGHLNGSDGHGHLNGSDGHGHLNGSDGRGHLNGSDGRGHLNGSDGRGHLNGSDGHGLVNGSDGRGLVNGSDGRGRETPIRGVTNGIIGRALCASDSSSRSLRISRQFQPLGSNGHTNNRSSSNALESQDSLDSYYDTYASLNRRGRTGDDLTNRSPLIMSTFRPRPQSLDRQLSLPLKCKGNYGGSSTENGIGSLATSNYCTPYQSSYFYLPEEMDSKTSTEEESETDDKSETSPQPAPISTITKELNKPDVTSLATVNTTNYIPYSDVLLKRSNVEQSDAGAEAKFATLSKRANTSSLNFAWKKNYIPSEFSQEPLLGTVSPVMTPVSNESKTDKGSQLSVNMYQFSKDGGCNTPRWSWRDEFSLSNFKLTHDLPHLFVTSQWQEHNRMSCPYLFYRVFVFLYFCLWFVWSAVVTDESSGSWRSLGIHFMYLTNWSMALLSLDLGLQAINVVMHIRRIAETGDCRYPHITFLQKISWMLSNITYSAHIFITLGYWTTVYPLRNDEVLSVLNINNHLVPGLYVLLDCLVSATPRRLFHFVFPVMYFVTYISCNLMFYLSGGTDLAGRTSLYPFLDWTRIRFTVLAVLVTLFLVIPLLHATHVLMYSLRIAIWRRYRINRYKQQDCDRLARYDEIVL